MVPRPISAGRLAVASAVTAAAAAVAAVTVTVLALVAVCVPTAEAAPERPDFVGTAWSLSGPARVAVKRVGKVRQQRQAVLTFDDATTATLDVADEGTYEFTWEAFGRKGNRVRFSYEAGSDTAFNDRLTQTIETVASTKFGTTVSDVVITPTRTKLEVVVDVKRRRMKLKGLRAFTGRTDALDKSFRGKYTVTARGGPALS